MSLHGPLADSPAAISGAMRRSSGRLKILVIGDVQILVLDLPRCLAASYAC
jgi:hypothetical protein